MIAKTAAALTCLLALPALAVGAGSAPVAGEKGQFEQLRLEVQRPSARHLQLEALRALAPMPLEQQALAAKEAPPQPQPAEATAATGTLTAETMATAPKPDGFAYTVVHDAIVDELSETLLYVKKAKDAQTLVAVPVPKDRALLAQCLAGGGVLDLVRGAIVTAKYDPRGVVRPEIILQSTPVIEVLDDARIVDRAGAKLFVMTADKQTRAFAIEGGAAAWASVVQNAAPDDLKPGTLVKIEYDPSGREGIRITLKQPPEPKVAAEDKGCGCQVLNGPRPLPWAGLAWALGALGLLWRRRSR